MKSPKSSTPPKSKSPEESEKRRSLPLMIRCVNGHSMMPTLPPGANVLGWRWFRRLRPGQVVIFTHDGKEKIKRIQKINKDGSLYLVGDHPSASTDSRHFGDVEQQAVMATVVWPNVRPRG